MFWDYNEHKFVIFSSYNTVTLLSDTKPYLRILLVDCIRYINLYASSLAVGPETRKAVFRVEAVFAIDCTIRIHQTTARPIY